ncbi:hypothetical protein EGH21_00730 [Halomicroarcula sp. F13]|uniref:DUF4129 domain-containing protein n=1 Tax=Haloarcula rubra TaxID=2487747 RepID=A0AAW4PKI3_9EURY|nr:hypothetical protein [Halomicroarcula rubra]MBX0321543.1 hypothetical protein [Halomicroarcula rubra]
MSETVTTDERTTDEVTVPTRDTATDPDETVTATRSARARVDGTVDRDDTGGWWRLFAAVGLVSLLAAVVVATVPGLVGSLVGAGTTATLRAAIPATAGLVTLLGLYGVVTRSHAADSDDPAPVELPTATPESMQGPTQTVVGDDVDDLLDRIDGRVDPYDGLEASYAADVRRRLRETVERTLVRRTGLDAEEAQDAVEAGTWTDDPRAASFLGGDGVPDPPLGRQVRDWASGEGFDRKVDATLAEIRRLRGGDGA